MPALTGEESYAKQAKTMAEHLLEKIGDKGNTPLTLDGQGWSMKYNLLWDKVLGLGLMPESFLRGGDCQLPAPHQHLRSAAGFPRRLYQVGLDLLDGPHGGRRGRSHRIDRAHCEGTAETTSRVPFSDWYDTKTGRYVAFIARSVQGGIFALML